MFPPTKPSRTNDQTRIPFLVALTPVRAQDGEAARHARFRSVLRLTTSTWPSPCAIPIPVIFSFHIPDISGQAPRCLRWFSPWHDGESPERNARFSADRAHAHMFTLSRTHLLVDFARVDGIVAYDTSHSCHAFSLNSRRNVGPGPSLLGARSTFPIMFVLCAFAPSRISDMLYHFLTSTMGCHVPCSMCLFNTQQVIRSRENYRVKPMEMYIFIRGVGNSDASWPSKARHLVLNLGTFLVGHFFCLLRPQGVRVPVPQQPVRTPQASRRVTASPRHYLRTFTSFFRPPRPLQPSRPKSFNHETRDLCSHACVEWVDNGVVEGGNTEYKQDKERSRITQIKTGTLFPTPPDTATLASESPFNHETRRLCSRACVGRAR